MLNEKLSSIRATLVVSLDEVKAQNRNVPLDTSSDIKRLLVRLQGTLEKACGDLNGLAAAFQKANTDLTQFTEALERVKKS